MRGGAGIQAKEWPVLIGLYLASALTRLPAVHNEMGPYLYCDEGMWSSELLRMSQSGTFITQEMRSGGANILPVRAVEFALRGVTAISLTGDSAVIFGRVTMTLFFGSLVTPFAYLIARQLGHTPRSSLLAGVMVLTSPALLAHSRYWYPDHYLSAAVAMSIFVALRVRRSRERRWMFVLGAAISFLISIKLSGLFLLPTLLGIALTATPKEDLDDWDLPVRSKFDSLRQIFWLSIGLVFTLILLNFSALVNPSKFLEDQRFNSTNYSGPGNGLEGIVYHLWIAGTTFYGVVGVVGIMAVALRARDQPRVFPALLALPAVFAAVSYGNSTYAIYRNMSVAFVPVVLLVYLGIRSIASCQLGTRSLRIFSLLLLLALTAVEFSAMYLSEFRTDSRELAEEFLLANENAYPVIGVNEFCSGVSPASVAQRQVIVDPMMEIGLETYLINAYWLSPLSPAYRDVRDLRYMQFYRYNDINFNTLLGPLPSSESLASLLPPDYVIVKVFSGSGPEMILVEKRREGVSG